ncbi:Uncharacterised protein [Citrobacter koseri]|uniref:Uncharacterized protein n=1 Tax=Citrobacter koseri TaxID=545 RepID=A0A447UKK7_CITKO|nr:Uncharacterised protein [Citrobacter koseri]STB47136.1 Uncharacterised protein [Citrobacter koseri]VEB88967.1 Uncharacterised protein [Citrobacter koseri]
MGAMNDHKNRALCEENYLLFFLQHFSFFFSFQNQT